tara:strand:+ start:1191 stop:1403 length:213 start_codon:yes stop_codon:yes gene_type:complete
VIEQTCSFDGGGRLTINPGRSVVCRTETVVWEGVASSPDGDSVMGDTNGGDLAAADVDSTLDSTVEEDTG